MLSAQVFIEDNFDPSIGIPLAIILWASVLLMWRRAYVVAKRSKNED